VGKKSRLALLSKPVARGIGWVGWIGFQTIGQCRYWWLTVRVHCCATNGTRSSRISWTKSDWMQFPVMPHSLPYISSYLPRARMPHRPIPEFILFIVCVLCVCFYTRS